MILLLINYSSFQGASQQLRAQLPAPGVAEAVLPLLLGVHWSACRLVLSLPAGRFRDQLCPLRLLPPGQDHSGSCSVPFDSARSGSLDEVVRPSPAKRKRLPVHLDTGSEEKCGENLNLNVFL